VVLYSLSVFLTFAISLFGLCVYWWRVRGARKWLQRLALSSIGFVVCAVIFAMLLAHKFADGGWVAALIIAALVTLCIYVRRHYERVKVQIRKIDEAFENIPFGSIAVAPQVDPEAPTAVFTVGSSRGGGMHALLWVQRMFPGHFRNFVFINARAVDAHSYGGAEQVQAMRTEANVALNYFVNFCHSRGLAAKSYLSFGTDPVEGFGELCEKVAQDFPSSIFFTSKLIFPRDDWIVRLLHNQAAMVLQRRLHLDGLQMVILPMRVEL